jgi:HEPN domain-containing protein
MDKAEIVTHWLISAEEDRKTAETLYVSQRYSWCLFFWHLTLEKTLKADITNLEKEIPFSHNLVQLAKLAEIPLTDKLESELKEITVFNLEARYDDYKMSFYQKATKDYTDRWISICEKYYSMFKRI